MIRGTEINILIPSPRAGPQTWTTPSILTLRFPFPSVPRLISGMNAFVATTCLLIAIAPQAEASIFSVKPKTSFYSAPNASEATRLRLQRFAFISPHQRQQGFCEFKLMYKIADRSNSALTQNQLGRAVFPSTSSSLPSQNTTVRCR